MPVWIAFCVSGQLPSLSPDIDHMLVHRLRRFPPAPKIIHWITTPCCSAYTMLFITLSLVSIKSRGSDPVHGKKKYNEHNHVVPMFGQRHEN